MPSQASRRGEIFLHRGNLTQARHWYEQAVIEGRNEGSPKDLSDALGNLGNVCALLQDHQKAEECYREVLEIQRTLQEGNTIGETLVNLGNLKTDTGQPEKARAYYLEALDALKPLENDRALGILYSNLAIQEFQLHRIEAAIEAFHAALEYHRKVGNEEGLAMTYGQLGKIFLLNGNSQQAESCLNNSTEHFIKLSNGVGEAGALRLLADLYVERKDPIAALRCLERVIQLDLTYQLPQYEEDEQRYQELHQN